MNLKMFYVANARMPTEKAHGIQIAKMCEAFIDEDIDVTLVVPRRQKYRISVRKYYGLRHDVPTIYLPVINTVRFGRMGYIVEAASFMVVSLAFLWWRRLLGDRSVVYTVDMDTFSSSLLPLAGGRVYTEMHNGKSGRFIQKFFFRHLSGVIAINRLLAADLQNTFRNIKVRYLVAPNGIDPTVFREGEKLAARKKLKINTTERIVLYVGRFLLWKGLEIVPEAATSTPELSWYLLGGTREEYVKVTDMEPAANMVFPGSVPQDIVPLWMAAADVLIVLGTKNDEQSWLYTSPMKIFEYLLAGRPIVASRTPAIEEILSDENTFFCEPNDPSSLAEVALRAATDVKLRDRKVTAARMLGMTTTWRERARNVCAFIQ